MAILYHLKSTGNTHTTIHRFHLHCNVYYLMLFKLWKKIIFLFRFPFFFIFPINTKRGIFSLNKIISTIREYNFYGCNIKWILTSFNHLILLSSVLEIKYQIKSTLKLLIDFIREEMVCNWMSLDEDQVKKNLNRFIPKESRKLLSTKMISTWIQCNTREEGLYSMYLISQVFFNSHTLIRLT